MPAVHESSRFSRSHQRSGWLLFSIWAIFVGVKGSLVVVLIFTSLMTSTSQYWTRFHFLLAILAPLFCNIPIPIFCLFKSWVIWLIIDIHEFFICSVWALFQIYIHNAHTCSIYYRYIYMYVYTYIWILTHILDICIISDEIIFFNFFFNIPAFPV